MSLVIIFRHSIAQMKVRRLLKEDFLDWLSSDGFDGRGNSSGICVAHHLLQEVDLESISVVRVMLKFVASCTEGQIFSFLMNRDLAGNTIGHVLCGQDFCQKYDVIALGILDAFFACLDKLSPQCRPDYLAAQGEASLILDDVIREMRIDSVKRAYYHFFQKEVSRPLSLSTGAFSTYIRTRQPVQQGNFFKSDEEIVAPPRPLKAGARDRKKIASTFQPIEPSLK